MKVILGAGLCGLALAHFLRDPEVLILEASSRAGGWVQTDRSSGFLLERGPHGFFASPPTLQLIQELGLELIEAPSGLPRYVWRSGSLRPVTRLPGPLQPLDGPDQSVEAACLAHYGPDLTRELIDPMVLGIYGAPPSQLSLRCAFPEGIGAMRTGPLYSLRDGMESLTRSLAARLAPQIRLNSPVRALRLLPHSVQIQLDQQCIEASQIYSTLPAPVLGQLLQEPSLQAFPMTSLYGMHMAYMCASLPLPGVGHLVPSCEGSPLLGIFWASTLFPQHNRHSEEVRLTLLCRQPMSPQQAVELVRLQLGLRDPDLLQSWSAPSAIPRYPVGWSARPRQFGPLGHADSMGPSPKRPRSLATECSCSDPRLAAFSLDWSTGWPALRNCPVWQGRARYFAPRPEQP
jgi:protoporphyrinogen oxidase